MLPWLFNMYMDGVVQPRTLRRGAQLVGDDNGKWKVSHLLFADDTVPVVDISRIVVGFLGEGNLWCK